MSLLSEDLKKLKQGGAAAKEVTDSWAKKAAERTAQAKPSTPVTQIASQPKQMSSSFYDDYQTRKAQQESSMFGLTPTNINKKLATKTTSPAVQFKSAEGIDTKNTVYADPNASWIESAWENAKKAVKDSGRAITNYLVDSSRQAVENDTDILLAEKMGTLDSKTAQEYRDWQNNVSAGVYKGIKERGEKAAEEQQKLDVKYGNVNNNDWAKRIGQVAGMAPYVAGSVINPNVGSAVLWAQVGGGGLEEALMDGATKEEARLFGMASAATEIAVEKLSAGLIGEEGGLLTKPAQKLLNKFITNKTLMKTIGEGVDLFGEGGEEIASSYITPYLKRLIYDPNAQLPTSEEIKEAFLGGVTGAVLLGAAPKATVSGINKLSSRAQTTPKTVQTVNVDKAKQTGKVTLDDIINYRKEKTATQNGAVDEVQEGVRPIRVGRATTIYNPYRGETPTRTKTTETVRQAIPDESVAQARQTIIAATNTETKKVSKSWVKAAYNKIFDALGGQHTVAVDGARFGGKPYEVSVNKRVVSKVVSDPHLSAEKLSVLSSLDSVIQNADYIGSGEYAQKEGANPKNVTRYDYFETPVSINGQDYVVTFDVEVFPYANNYRTHKVINEMDLIPVQGTDAGPVPTAPEKVSSPSAISISQNEEKSNGNFVENVDAGNVFEFRNKVSDKVVDPETRERVESLAEKYGRGIIWYSDNSEGADNGFYDREGNIHINEYAENPEMVVFGHEMFHSFDEDSKNTLINFFKENANQNSAAFRAYQEDLIARYTERYAKDGRTFDPDTDFWEEFAAENIETFFADEAFVNKLARENRTLLQKVLNFIRDFLDIFKAPTSYTGKTSVASEAAGFSDATLRKAEKMLEKALSESTDGTSYDTEIKYSTSYDFKHQVDDALDGKLKRGYSVYFGRTPNLLRKCGLDGLLPMLMNQSHLRDINTPKDSKNVHFYCLSRDIIKQLPEEIKHPVMIYDSISPENKENAVCVLTSLRDEDGLPIIVVIKANSDGNNKYYDISGDTIKPEKSNFAASAYGKTGFGSHIESLLDEGAILYANKNKTLKLFSDIGLQLPERLNNLGFDIIIHKSNNIVNPNLQKNNANQNMYSVPRDGKETSAFYENIQSAETVEDQVKQMVDDNIDLFTYEPITNKETMEKVTLEVLQDPEGEYKRFFDTPSHAGTRDTIVRGFVLLQQLQQKGKYQDAVNVATKLREIGTKKGQEVQAFSILKKFTPEGMLYWSQEELNKVFEEAAKGKHRDQVNKLREALTLTDEEAEFITDTMYRVQNMIDGRDKNVMIAGIRKLLQRKAAEALPKGKKIPDQIKAALRIMMLGNPKTVITRNAFSNLVSVPMHQAAEGFAVLIDKNIAKRTGVRATPEGIFGKDFWSGFGQGAVDSFDDFRRGIDTRAIEQGRYDLEKSSDLLSGPTFNGKFNPLTYAERFVNFALDAGDRPFYNAYLLQTLNGLVEANGVKTATPAMLKIAADVAAERTWQNENVATNAAKKIRDGLNLIGTKGAKMLLHMEDQGNNFGAGDLANPFIKTGANLLVAALEYSPVSLVTAITTDTKRLENELSKRGDSRYDQNKVEENIMYAQRNLATSFGKGITGAIMLGIATALGAAGLITGKDDEEDKDAKNFRRNILGINDYSLRIGDKSITYDWIQPYGTMLATVAEIAESARGDSTTKGTMQSAAGILQNALSAGGNALLERSFLEGVQSLFAEESLVDGLIELFSGNFASQATPSITKQLAELTDPIARKTYDADPAKRVLNIIKSRLPGLSKSLAPVVDVFGREVERYGGKNNAFNVFLNPSNVSSAKKTPESEEIWRLYEQTGRKEVFPTTAPTSIQKNGATHKLSAAEQTQYQRTAGQKAAEDLKRLFASNGYKQATDEEKADLVYGVVERAQKQATAEFLKGKDIFANNKEKIVYEIKDNKDEYATWATVEPSAKNNRDAVSAINVSSFLSYADKNGKLTESEAVKFKNYVSALESKTTTELDNEIYRLRDSFNYLKEDDETQDTGVEIMSSPGGLFEFTQHKVKYRINVPPKYLYTLYTNTEERIRNEMSRVIRTFAYKNASIIEKKKMLSDAKGDVRASVRNELKRKYGYSVDTDFDKAMRMK